MTVIFVSFQPILDFPPKPIPMKKLHLSPPTLAHLNGQHEARQLLAALLRILGLHRLELALEITAESFEEAALHPYFRLPPSPLNFLLSIAKRKTLEAVRMQNMTGRLSREVNFAIETGKPLEEVFHGIFEEKTLEDNRLALLFACCHPSLPLSLRKALVLKSNFTFSEKDIQQFRHSDDLRLLKELETSSELILQNGVQSGVPTPGQLPARLGSVQETLLSLFMDGYDHSELTIFARRSFCDTAFQVCSLLLAHPATTLPTTYATMTSLCLLAARFEPRRGRPPSFLFLDEKNRAKWSPQLIDQGVAYYEKAGDPDQPDDQHLLARVLMEHTLAPHPRFTNWERIAEHLQHLLEVHPTYEYHLCYAYTLAKNGDATLAIQHLYAAPGFGDHLPEDWLTNALMGDFYRQAKNLRECAKYYQVAQQKAPATALKKLLHRKMLSLTSNKKGSKKKVKW
jgi:RNA polymerase sigma-70 factor (ECF subfamily)